MDRVDEVLALTDWAPDDVASFQLQNPRGSALGAL